ncbi:hypothetical protein FRB98_005786 [Tulasnella sp. 332]|nr:hypothetical protein FRB98_005786 [Tulasnella sp. 332]
MSASKTYVPARDIPDLTGKVALVTGGNAGIGLYTVAELVKHGAKVYMGSRSESRATGAMSQLKAEGYLEGTKGEVVWQKLDISKPALARASAEEFLQRETRLDILVHNAGLSASPEHFQKVDPETAISAIMSTNHLGPFALTATLLPLLKKTAEAPGSDVRIVTVTSKAYSMAKKVSWKSTEEWLFKSGGFLNNTGFYGTTKLANILFSKELQRRLDAEGSDVISISIHPGEVATAMADEFFGGWALSRLMNVIFKFMGWYLTPQEGAYNSLFAATAPIVRKEKTRYAGAFLIPFGVWKEASSEANDPVAAQELWDTSERVVSGI